MKKLLLFTTILLLAFCWASCSKTEHESFGTLYGIVSDVTEGDPLGNAVVTLSPGGKSQTTGNDGRYEFPELDPQQYTITVQKTGYSTNRKTVTAIVGEKTEANITLAVNQ